MCFWCAVAWWLWAPAPAGGGNWPQWRGPFFNGSTSETNLPTQWSKTENVAWTTPLPGKSGATPVIWEDSVFVSSPDAQKNLLLFCLERRTGAVRWQRVVSAGDFQEGHNNAAAPSPVTDGQIVVVLFGTGDLAAFDFTGKELWKRGLAKEYGAFANMWIYGSSPMLYRDRLYVQVLQSNPVPGYRHAQDGKSERESFLLCLEPGSGKTHWRQVRQTQARGESMEAYSTPIPADGPRGSEILVLGADCLTAHHPETGAELWRWDELNPRRQTIFRVVPCPVVVDGAIIVCGPKGEPVYAIRDGKQVAWKFGEFPSDCATPLFYRNRLFLLDGDRQTLTCFEPRTGEKKWQGNLGVRHIFRASPTGADGKIYCLSESGTAVVIDAGEEFKVLATIPMGESPAQSSIAIAQGQLFLRTAKAIYCVGKP